MVSTHSREKAAARYSGKIVKSRRFQHTAARRRLHGQPIFNRLPARFNTQPHEGGCHLRSRRGRSHCGFNTQPHEGGCIHLIRAIYLVACFNTQPHEGGCRHIRTVKPHAKAFQHTAARRRLLASRCASQGRQSVSTHSRTKAAAGANGEFIRRAAVSTHSRTKAAAVATFSLNLALGVSTHSRTKAAARICRFQLIRLLSFNTQPHEGGCPASRLVEDVCLNVSTHSRTKAAASPARSRGSN